MILVLRSRNSDDIYTLDGLPREPTILLHAIPQMAIIKLKTHLILLINLVDSPKAQIMSEQELQRLRKQ